MSLGPSITATATKVYSPGTRKYNEKVCLDSSSGGTSSVISLREPEKTVNNKVSQAGNNQLHAALTQELLIVTM